MRGYECPCCGRHFDNMPFDIGMQLPDPLLRIPEHERDERAEWNSDYCVMDRELAFIRAFLPLPVQGTDKVFGWGFWCRIGRDDYNAYVAHDKGDVESIPPFRAWIANTAAAYEELEGLEARAEAYDSTKRARLTVVPCDHPLYIEQRNGIPLERVHEINAAMFPGDY